MQAEYEKEEIEWSYIEFVDNQDVLDLIEAKMGILDLLDETCRFPKVPTNHTHSLRLASLQALGPASHITPCISEGLAPPTWRSCTMQATNDDLAQKLYTAPTVKDSSRFSKPKLARTDFTIDHYAGAADAVALTAVAINSLSVFDCFQLCCAVAGAVTYKTDNFLDKNRDFVVAEHQALLSASSQAFVHVLFPSEAESGSASGGRAMQSYKFSSVGSRFKKQVRIATCHGPENTCSLSVEAVCFCCLWFAHVLH